MVQTWIHVIGECKHVEADWVDGTRVAWPIWTISFPKSKIAIASPLSLHLIHHLSCSILLLFEMSHKQKVCKIHARGAKVDRVVERKGDRTNWEVRYVGRVNQIVHKCAAGM